MLPMTPVTPQHSPATDRVLNRILLPASIAGICAALVLTLAQALWVTPLILQAEGLEKIAQSGEHHAHEHGAGGHHHDEEAWQPEDGWSRTLWTTASNSVMGIGYALILCGLYQLRQPTGWVQGMLWGTAGYFAFFAAPAIGLPPELPGTESADLVARQAWWLVTALATSVGLGLVLLQSRMALRVVGVALVLIPHAIGAPHPEIAGSLASEQMQLDFHIATSSTNALFWVLLGALSAAAFRHFSGKQDNENG